MIDGPERFAEKQDLDLEAEWVGVSSYFAIARSPNGADNQRMLNLVITMELQADGIGPHEFYTERVTLPGHFARSAVHAHAKLVK